MFWGFDVFMFSPLLENSWMKRKVRRWWEYQFQRPYAPESRRRDWQAFELICKGMGNSSAYTMLLISYPLLQAVGNQSVSRFFFPLGQRTLIFVLIASASDMLQDIILIMLINKTSVYPSRTHGTLSSFGAKTTVITVVSCGAWVIVAFVHLAMLQIH